MSKKTSTFQGRHGLGAVQTIADFRAISDAQPNLTSSDRQILVEQAEILIRDLYVHLPLKRAMHAVDPVQRLRLLHNKLETLSEREFHADLLDIFKDLRDLHTNYSLPAPYRGRIAFIGILIEAYDEGGQTRWMVSKVADHLVTDPELQPGAVITHWNGVPMDLAVWRNANKEAGSNRAARYARGLESMALRFLGASLPPDEDWVDLVYRTDNGLHETRLAWQVFEGVSDLLGGAPDAGGLLKDLRTPLRYQVGVDQRTELMRQAKKQLFAPAAMREEVRVAKYEGKVPRTTAAFTEANIIPTTRPDDLTARLVQTASGTFGFLRLWTFHMKDRDVTAFIVEIMRLLTEEFPPEGLIIDVRGNGGGYIIAAEFLLQFLTHRKIEPEPTQFINTPATLALTAKVASMNDWRKSLLQGIATGASYSSGIPLSQPKVVNSIGQLYHGPVVLITDAFCYSACDMFAAGFQDHRIGKILGVDTATGAGGANVLTHEALADDWIGGPLRPLPAGAGMRISLRRTLRVGERVGQPVEDLGVEPDILIPFSRDDLLEGNRDLYDRAGEFLALGTPRVLKAEVTSVQGQTAMINLTTLNISEVDIYVNDRPQASVNTSDGVTSLSIQLPTGGRKVRLEGFEDGDLVGARQIKLLLDTETTESPR
ncbi:S41 family peptidase [Candidatus Thiosymbion oneisti]|uniref:S41 family peptidase n=1 Tax=Candidatus Thiosymbion oneisti TaxID=589554 RepID=UPI000ACB2BA5|nr:S41 family peptidase [Candidatus Thiosymbion oneisti]